MNTPMINSLGVLDGFIVTVQSKWELKKGRTSCRVYTANLCVRIGTEMSVSDYLMKGKVTEESQ